MINDNMREFFSTSAEVSGALIGLLFVAISIATDRLAESGTMQVNRISSRAALTAFVNTLCVSLFALIPGSQVGTVAAVEAVVGLLFVTGSLLSLKRLRRADRMQRGDLLNAAFLIGLLVTFVVQLVVGIEENVHPGDSSWIHRIATLVIVCFLIGVTRSWDLIGGPTIGVGPELVHIVKGKAGSK